MDSFTQLCFDHSIKKCDDMNISDNLHTNSQDKLREKETKATIKPSNKKLISKGSIDSVFGLWKNRDISLDEIREDQWVRKTK